MEINKIKKEEENTVVGIDLRAYNQSRRWISVREATPINVSEPRGQVVRAFAPASGEGKVPLKLSIFSWSVVPNEGLGGFPLLVLSTVIGSKLVFWSWSTEYSTLLCSTTSFKRAMSLVCFCQFQCHFHGQCKD